MRILSLVAVAAFSSLVFGCSADVDGVATEESSTDDQEITQTASSTAFVVTRDYRRCVSPLCGGFWVKAANKAKTTCADGSRAAECYVATLDVTAPGLDASAVDGMTSFLAVGRVAPKRYPNFGNLGRLVASQLWSPANPDLPTGTLYSVRDNGIRCITTPCFSTTADKVNSAASRTLSGLRGGMAGKAGDLVGQNIPVIMAGAIESAPDGGRELAITQFYRQIEVSLTACTTDAECIATAFHKPIASASDCYCAMCPTTAANSAVASSFQASHQALCGGLRCPMVKCMAPPPVACVNNACQFASLDGAN